MLPVLMFACVYLCMYVCVCVCFCKTIVLLFMLLFLISYFCFSVCFPLYFWVSAVANSLCCFFFVACMELFWTCELLNAQTHQFYSINLDCTFHLSFTSFLLSMYLSLALLFVLFLVCLSSGSVMMMNRMNFQ